MKILTSISTNKTTFILKKNLLSGFGSSSDNESFGMFTYNSESKYTLIQKETQSRSTAQIRKKRKVELDDKFKMANLSIDGWNC